MSDEDKKGGIEQFMGQTPAQTSGLVFTKHANVSCNQREQASTMTIQHNIGAYGLILIETKQSRKAGQTLLLDKHSNFL
jgi:hypothetical protein